MPYRRNAIWVLVAVMTALPVTGTVVGSADVHGHGSGLGCARAFGSPGQLCRAGRPGMQVASGMQDTATRQAALAVFRRGGMHVTGAA
jgi:hypothetical protein